MIERVGRPHTLLASIAIVVLAVALSLVPSPGNSASGPDDEPGSAAVCTISGNRKDNVLRGTSGEDYICGKGGDDTIYARGSDDVVLGGSGDDVIRGGDGIDWLDGDGGDDKIYGEEGADDLLMGNGGSDLLSGGPGDEYCMDGQDGAGVDTLKGGDGLDQGLVDVGDTVLGVEFMATCLF